MTAPTPEQMRALADLSASNFPLYTVEIRAALRAAAEGIEFQADQIETAVAQYRAAADQLEAVKTAARLNLAEGSNTGLSRYLLDVVLAADTAPHNNHRLAGRARREDWHDIDGNETHR